MNRNHSQINIMSEEEDNNLDFGDGHNDIEDEDDRRRLRDLDNPIEPVAQRQQVTTLVEPPVMEIRNPHHKVNTTYITTTVKKMLDEYAIGMRKLIYLRCLRVVVHTSDTNTFLYTKKGKE